jgi:NAD(P)-dependent dehydrogenase (short-subunit alcohol dehydrogenase family)
VPTDVKVEERVIALVERAVEELGRVEILVNNGRVDGRLRGGEVSEGSAGEPFALERLVESFHLPGRGR